MRLTAKDVSDRLGMSYVVASGLLTHLKNAGRATVVEKRIVGKGRPTLVYEVDQHTIFDFGNVTVPVATEEVTIDHVAAALGRLREAQSDAA